MSLANSCGIKPLGYIEERPMTHPRVVYDVLGGNEDAMKVLVTAYEEEVRRNTLERSNGRVTHSSFMLPQMRFNATMLQELMKHKYGGNPYSVHALGNLLDRLSKLRLFTASRERGATETEFTLTRSGMEYAISILSASAMGNELYQQCVRRSGHAEPRERA